MPAKTNGNATGASNIQSDPNAFAEDYLADWDEEDPFASPPPEGAKKPGNDKKRKEPDTLGIDEQIDLKKKPRVPRVKLDDARLLSDKGIPRLQKMAPRLKLKGKGHEFSDASRLLSFYQEWLDDLFPKATFLDALAMVEKTGHKTTMRNARLKWIDDLKPRASVEEDDLFAERQTSAPTEPSRIAPIFEKAAGDRSKTPAAGDDLFGDDDIYNATPRRNTAAQSTDNVPDEDDLDALMAEAESNAAPPKPTVTTRPVPKFGSIFGNGLAKKPAQPSGEPDEDDLDALMAEAETQGASSSSKSHQPTTTTSIFGNGISKAAPGQSNVDEEDDLDALMAEAEAGANSTSLPTHSKPTGASEKEAAKGPDDDDDLDALMAEAEAEVQTKTPPPAKAANSEGKDDKQKQSFADDKEAMAEMEGLW